MNRTPLGSYNMFHVIYHITGTTLLLFILTTNGDLPGASGNTIRHNKQITHITQNNIRIKRNTAHKTAHTIEDILYTMNTNNHIYINVLP
jgi:hypothetical protein